MKTKKCKHCKEAFSPWNSLQKYCLKEYCVSVMINESKKKEWSKRKAKMKADLMTASDYKKLAQQVFNQYIRLRDKGLNCISCGEKINGVKHASHFFSSGGHSNLRYNEDNVWVSCYKCNVMLSGNQLEYRKRLINKIGLEKVQWLEDNAHIEKKWSIEELKEIIANYKEKVRKLKKSYI